METGPDPKAARTAAEFVVAMRQLRSWSDLSYRQLERKAEAAGDVLPRATISGALSRDDLPREQLLAAFVRACGGDEETVASWLTARRRLSIATSGSESPAASEAMSGAASGAVSGAAPAAGPAAASVAASEAAPEPDADAAVGAAGPRASEAATPAVTPLHGPPSADPAERRHEISRPAEGAEVLASGKEPGSAPAEPTSGLAWRRRYLPTLAVGLSAAVGVLLLAYGPFSGSDGSGPDARSGAGAGPSTDAASPSKSSDTSDTSDTADTSKTPGTKEPIADDDTAPASPTRDASSSKPGPTATATGSKPRLPAAGPTRIHPVSASDLCISEGRERGNPQSDEIAAQMPCADVPLPRVSLDAVGDGVYRIQWDHPDPNKGLGCLTVNGGAKDQGALLYPDRCSDADNRKFRLEPSHGGFRLRPVHSGLCVGIQSPRTEGAEAIQTACTGAADQAFRFTAP
ncbi:RICIN domain-containing protein [Streptomyces sp. NPDC097640]|uniref:RICIN domain-containing protein n=1 Tax=Streptomyces sp. NPDC097640 TaxID=3157229 RepID=UPI0033222A79